MVPRATRVPLRTGSQHQYGRDLLTLGASLAQDTARGTSFSSGLVLRRSMDT
jgi:hypothetical protein